MTDAGPANRRRRRGIYLLPNVLTTAALFFGFFAITAGMRGDYEAAALALYAAMVLDGLDGRVARLTQTQTDFGIQYDSIADMVSFGIAPSVVVYQWALQDLALLGDLWGRLGWVGAFVYVGCAGLRLARFNTQAGVADKRFFQGLPSPAAAASVAGLVWAGSGLGLDGWPVGLVAFVMTTAAGLLMVSNIRYYSFKEIDAPYRVSFLSVVLLVLAVAAVLALTLMHPPSVLFVLGVGYMASGPSVTVVQRRRRRREHRMLHQGS
jgi:CDP-diacylglycerol--serine O-phosphatidyltransferase